MVITRSLSRASQSSHGSNISTNFSPNVANNENSPKIAECSTADSSLLLDDNVSLPSSIDVEQFVLEQENVQIDYPVVLPESDPSYHRRLFIMQSGFKSGEIYSMPHPRTGDSSLYLLNEKAEPSELMQLDLENHQRRRSLFCGDTVVADPGPILMFLAVHPLFLALPHFVANARDHFLSPREFLHHDQFPALKLLVQNEKLLETLKIVADFEEEVEVKLAPRFRFNNDKLMDWLKMKFSGLKESLKANVENGMTGDEGEQHSFGILADYLPPSIAFQLREQLEICEEAKKAVCIKNGTKTPATPVGMCQKSKINNSRKRPAANPLGSFNTPKATPATKKRMSKVLVAASKGTQSLHSFFTGIVGGNQQQKKEKVEKDEEENGQSSSS